MIRVGETFVWGKDKATAQSLLQAARDTDHDVHDVRTTINGFVVPDAVAEAAAEALHAEPMPDNTDPEHQF